ncbi:MAG: zinc transporter [Rickettsiales bacterium]|nr:zinc transporter [Rickettsiales bacterium]|tara:strand:+ start:57 stop:743 length:687 start_codon:yes stop_codon:yes gene_type:complete
MTLIITVFVVSAALIVGVLWGVYGRMSKGTEGFILALAGGALLLSTTTELVLPSKEATSMTWVAVWLLAGAALFSIANYIIDTRFQSSQGGGLLAAIAMDGIPENLALGVALIGAGFHEVLALACSIFLSNLPEAAGGAKEMKSDGMSNRRIITLWTATAIILSLAAIAGYYLMDTASDKSLAAVRCLAAGAVIASLATEVFPTAFHQDHNLSGIAAALGVVMVMLLQ